MTKEQAEKIKQVVDSLVEVDTINPVIPNEVWIEFTTMGRVISVYIKEPTMGTSSNIIKHYTDRE